ncbi:MAG: hypothetical protein NC420_10555 [Eubacterium sp.]|nr:hypothetical protein [Eubacterium sp.]MCM1214337.1 hypothetical protein [Lachnospiraceae bacterium]MCM1304984.1 hypothetical protein [Butyrivibrio sp.]MCM1344347.1 hypothetical protein [Muribaculaceae bacterium]MCM1238629.1 hypothetical protein [Lachnospiraceae bacterium]
MKRNMDKEKKELFTAALQGKNIPILTLDNKWYRLLDEEERKAVSEIEDEMNALLKRQGRLNTEKKEIKKLKKKLMGEIVTMVDAAGDHPTSAQTKKIEQHKQKIEESNEKLEEYEDELLDLPKQIDRLNIQLMLATMEFCYEDMQENTERIQEIADWVTKIRIELKKRLIKKQEMEQKNHAIYSYMNDLFGADVMDMFDLEYDPEVQHPVMPGSGASEKQEPKA